MTEAIIDVNHIDTLSFQVSNVKFNDLHTNYTTHLFVHETFGLDVKAFINSGDYNLSDVDVNAGFIASNLPFNAETRPIVSLTHYYDSNNKRYPLTGRLSTYYVYPYVEDDVGQHAYLVNAESRSISTSNLIKDVTLTTSTNRDYVKTGDIVYLNWKTKYRVENVDLFEGVTLMNTSNLSPTVSSDIWTVSNVVTSDYLDGIATFEIELFGTSYSNLNQFPYEGSATRVVDDVTIDNTPPVFTFGYNVASVSSSNIAFSFPTFATSEQLEFGDMELQITMVQTSDTTQSNIESFTMTSSMVPSSTLFNITGLQDNTQYNVSATITDYAQNISSNIIVNETTVWTDTRIPLFVGGNAIISHLGSHRISVSNIAVYDSYHDCSLYVCAMEHEFTEVYTGDVLNSNELYQFMTSNEPSIQNNAIQTLIDITDNRDNVLLNQSSNVYLFTHAINAQGLEVRIKESTDYDIFYFATVDHEGEDNDVSFGNLLNITTNAFIETMKPYELSDLISSFGIIGQEIEYESIEGFFGSSVNITLETTPTLQNSIFDGNSYILYQNEHLPVNKTFTDFTYMIDFTFKNLSVNPHENMIFYQVSTHKLCYNKRENYFELTWGGDTINIPLGITEGISTQIGLSIDIRGGKILLSVNGNVYTQEDYPATASSHMDFLVGNSSSVGGTSRGLDGTLNYVFFWTRRFLTGKEICSAFLSHNRVLEYTFDTFSSYTGSNVYTNERYVDLPLHIQNTVNIETEYPRTGSKSIILSDPIGYLYNDDITSAKLNGNDMTVMFWFMTPNATIPTGIMELSTERNETVLIKITNDNNKTRMVINLTNEMGMVHSMVSQKITLDNDKWYHLSFVLADTSVLFYLNGIYKGSSLEPMTGLHTNFEDVTFFKELKLGGLNTLINTKIDHLIIYNKALTRQKILLN